MKRILIVDDHPLILKFMTNHLEKEGHQVLTAQDGLSALDILNTFVPDIMFVDLVMPNISGDKLCSIIRKMPKLRDTYLVVLSAIAAEDENINLSELGVDACIAKCRFDKMGKHILAALDQADLGTSTGFTGEILGIEEVRSRQITKELLSAKRHYEVILESIDEGILEITSDARIIYVNRVAATLTGKSDEDVLGLNFTELFHETDRPRIISLLEAKKTSSQAITKDSPVMLNGRQVVFKILRLQEEENKSVVILKDVTEEKQREVQIRQAQKMEAIGTLAGGIAHKFNNLLMGIQGNTSLMLLSTDSSNRQHKRLTNIGKLVQSGSRLTDQLLGYAREGRYEIKPVNLNELVEETSETIGRTKKKITVHRDLANNLFMIEADRKQIEQTLLNLYVNAADAMPEGGNLFLKTINVTHNDMDTRIHNPKPGNYVMIAVTDTGTGMEEKTRERIFDPFFSTKETGQGTGLGLAAAYGIIKGHGGYIDVKSRKGKGTTFKIYLPAKEPEGKTEGVGVGETSEAFVHGKTILLVDDEKIVREVAQEMLQVMGCKVLTAKGGKDAIKIYEKNGDTIDLVLLDMVMPDMGGSKVYDRLKEKDPGIKVLLSSGYSIDGEAMEIMERGCHGFIQKPFNISDLSQEIKKILNND